MSLVFDLSELINDVLLLQVFFCPCLEMFPWLKAIWSNLRKGIVALWQLVFQVTDGTDGPRALVFQHFFFWSGPLVSPVAATFRSMTCTGWTFGALRCRGVPLSAIRLWTERGREWAFRDFSATSTLSVPQFLSKVICQRSIGQRTCIHFALLG